MNQTLEKIKQMEKEGRKVPFKVDISERDSSLKAYVSKNGHTR